MRPTSGIGRGIWAVGLALGLAAGAARADDWPQWLGPKRDGVWREKGILDKFPAKGPKELWRTPSRRPQVSAESGLTLMVVSTGLPTTPGGV